MMAAAAPQKSHKCDFQRRTPLAEFHSAAEPPPLAVTSRFVSHRISQFFPKKHLTSTLYYAIIFADNARVGIGAPVSLENECGSL